MKYCLGLCGVLLIITSPVVADEPSKSCAQAIHGKWATDEPERIFSGIAVNCPELPVDEVCRGVAVELIDWKPEDRGQVASKCLKSLCTQEAAKAAFKTGESGFGAALREGCDVKSDLTDATDRQSLGFGGVGNWLIAESLYRAGREHFGEGENLKALKRVLRIALFEVEQPEELSEACVAVLEQYYFEPPYVGQGAPVLKALAESCSFPKAHAICIEVAKLDRHEDPAGYMDKGNSCVFELVGPKLAERIRESELNEIYDVVMTSRGPLSDGKIKKHARIFDIEAPSQLIDWAIAESMSHGMPQSLRRRWREDIRVLLGHTVANGTLDPAHFDAEK